MSGEAPAPSAREEILQRIRAAMPHASAASAAESHVALPREYVRRGALSREECLALLIDRLRDYEADVIEVAGTAELSQAIEAALVRRGETRVLAAVEFPGEWLPDSVQVVRDEALTLEQLDGERVVVTTSEAAVASTGTIVLVHAGAQGRRAITLLPDHHLCLVRRASVRETLPEVWTMIAPSSTLPLTTVSGPSATSDIEMTRVRGVHGPRFLTVILY
jgi:L-lactate dehydrogenase complex protein LldG